MTLVDSSVWIDYFRGTATPQVARLDALLASEPVAICDLMLAEVLQGFASDRDFNEARRLLTGLTVVHIGGADIAVQAARNYRSLRALGVTVRKTIGCLIATCCIEGGLTLLHDDRDFDAFERHLGLRVD
ncbi:MAG: VapC toxin family PIN domain ribonuclease [Burkholderiales bacterium PBB5]|nr:MAG: VapC toxin family PIN domain ribonuclease [Burkholderiales bacterium PBB5]